MAYVCDLGSGQRLDLDIQGTQTIVAISSSSTGQQQQSTSSLQTGAWTSPPEVYRTSEGVVVKLQTAQGSQYIQIQGSSISLSTNASGLSTEPLPTQQTKIPNSTLPPMQPMEPMKPMQPMTMGNMQMNLKPMEMRMGDMEMRMGAPAADSSANATTPAPTQQFCSQCGVSVKPSDRFCTSCGHAIT